MIYECLGICDCQMNREKFEENTIDRIFIQVYDISFRGISHEYAHILCIASNVGNVAT